MDKSIDPKEWLNRAYGCLLRARKPIEEGMYYEDFCYDCQQAAEKALKALIVRLGLDLHRTHSFRKLLNELTKRIIIPESIFDVLKIEVYAVTTRYPDDFIEVSENEYREALEIAQRVYDWTSENIK
ncbi:MAG: HEPN domain-containing protein [Spirochaetaceae bacterium]